MNHDPFDERLSRELWSLVADADPPGTLRPGAGRGRVMPRPFILVGSVAAAVAVIAALLVAPGGSGDHRQHVAAEGSTSTTTESGVIVPVAGDQSTPSSTSPTTTTTAPQRSSTTLPKILGTPTIPPRTSVPPKPLSMTRYSLDGWYWAITQGSDGNMWAIDGGDVARITPNGQVTKFALPPSQCGPPCIAEGITAGPDGNVWFTVPEQAAIGRITPSGQITEFPTPASARGITAGPDGALWFRAAEQVGRITTAGSTTMFPAPGSASGIARGADGNLWFTGGYNIERITPAGVVTQYPVQHQYGGATLGHDGNVWFQPWPNNNGDPIARVTTSGDVTEFGGLPGSSFTGGITAGPDGSVWCLEHPGDRVFRVEPNGRITTFSNEGAGNQFSIAPGPGGTLWVAFTAGDGFAGVAKFSPPPA